MFLGGFLGAAEEHEEDALCINASCEPKIYYHFRYSQVLIYWKP